VTDEEILSAHRWLSAREGVFVEPGSAAGVAGLIKKHAAGEVPAGRTIVITVTGHGLKDPQWALRIPGGGEVQPTVVPVDTNTIADVLGLSPAAAGAA
jgi:threonine synthase